MAIPKVTLLEAAIQCIEEDPGNIVVGRAVKVLLARTRMTNMKCPHCKVEMSPYNDKFIKGKTWYRCPNCAYKASEVTPEEQVCAFCNRKRKHHYLVNYSDANLVSAQVLVCPTAVFTTVMKQKDD